VVYVLCRHNSSCWAEFRFLRYVIGSVVFFVLLTITHLRPLKLGCCAKLAVSVICDGLLVRCAALCSLMLVFLFLGDSHMCTYPPHEIVLLCICLL
jgi:hypothetical protein